MEKAAGEDRQDRESDKEDGDPLQSLPSPGVEIATAGEGQVAPLADYLGEDFRRALVGCLVLEFAGCGETRGQQRTDELPP